MAITLTKNLKLKINSSFDDVSKYNLQKIDTLASIFQINTNDQAVIRSRNEVLIQPNSPDIGGTGSGGQVLMGQTDQPLDHLVVHSDSVTFAGGSISFGDVATGGNKKLTIQYKSDISGTVETTSNRLINIDLNGGDRDLVLGGNFKLLSGNLTLNIPTSTTWTLPTTSGTSGQVLTTDGLGVLDWTSPSGANTQQVVIWSAADGPTKLITHSLNSQNVKVEVLDSSANYATIGIDTISRPSTSTIFLGAVQAPTTSWIVLINKVS